MAKKTEETGVVVVEQQPQSLIGRKADNDLVPDFMRGGEADHSLELLKRVIRPPRLKTIQGTRSPDYQDFLPGQVVMTPSKVVVAGPDEPFYFVPLLYYPEWACVNPYEMRGQLNMIRSRSLDISSEIAMKAMDERRRSAEICPEDSTRKYYLKYKEYFVFICWLVATRDVPGQPVLLSFSGGEYGTGQNLASAISNRNIKKMYGCVFEAKCPSVTRQRKGYSWYGIDVYNPMSPGCPHPFVQSREDFEQFGQLHDQYFETYARGLASFQADLGEEDIAADAQAAGTAATADEKRF